MRCVKEGRFEEGCKALDLTVLSSYFVQVGVPKHHTDNECAAWVSEVMTKPIVTILRIQKHEKEQLVQSSRDLDALHTACKKTFSGVARLTHMVNQVSSAAVLVRFAAHIAEAKQSVAPSVLRAANSDIEALNNKSPIKLGFEHGMLGRAVMQAVSAALKKSALDEVSDQKIMKAAKSCAEFSKDTAENIPTNAIKKELTAVMSCLDMWTPNGLETNIPVLQEIDGHIGEVLTKKLRCMESEVIAAISPMSDDLVVLRAMTTTTKSTTETTMKTATSVADAKRADDSSIVNAEVVAAEPSSGKPAASPEGLPTTVVARLAAFATKDGRALLDTWKAFADVCDAHQKYQATP